MNFKETLVIEILDEGDLTVEDQQALLPLIDRYIAGSSPDIADPVEVAVALAEAASKKIQAEGLESSLIDFLSAMPELQIYLQHDNWSQIQGRLVLYASAQELRNLASEEARESLLADGPARAQGIGISAPDFEEVVRRMCEYRDSLGE